MDTSYGHTYCTYRPGSWEREGTLVVQREFKTMVLGVNVFCFSIWEVEALGFTTKQLLDQLK